MITAQEIKAFYQQGIDIAEAERLKSKFAQLRRERIPFYLTASEFDEILKWKLRQQYGRGQHLRSANSDEVIRKVTELALTIAHPSDKEYEFELRINILCVLRGVGIPVASAVLALVFPKEYAVIDFRGWRQFFGDTRTGSDFSIPDYNRYMEKIRSLAKELGWQAQEVDLAIWEYDRQKSKR